MWANLNHGMHCVLKSHQFLSSPSSKASNVFITSSYVFHFIYFVWLWWLLGGCFFKNFKKQKTHWLNCLVQTAAPPPPKSNQISIEKYEKSSGRWKMSYEYFWNRQTISVPRINSKKAHEHYIFFVEYQKKE